MVTKKNKPQNVTTLGLDVRKDYRNRMVTYTVIMVVRIVCIFLLLVIPFPYNILPILIAVFASWFAVLIANNKKTVAPTEITPPILSLDK